MSIPILCRSQILKQYQMESGQITGQLFRLESESPALFIFPEILENLLESGFLFKVAQECPAIENLCGGQCSPPLAQDPPFWFLPVP